MNANEKSHRDPFLPTLYYSAPPPYRIPMATESIFSLRPQSSISWTALSQSLVDSGDIFLVRFLEWRSKLIGGAVGWKAIPV